MIRFCRFVHPLAVIGILLYLSATGYGADKVYEAMEAKTPPVLDGILNEPIWRQA